ncbi:uncharacterized protein LOC144108803 [Amblyomma americanum]
MGRCCVPGCRGNYHGGPKVRVFGFPKDEAHRKAWMRAVPRKDFTPTIHSKVCELHFHEQDFITKLSHHDKQTGRTIELKRDRVQLQKGAVPSVFPNCPSYLSSTPSCRESPARKRARRENDAIQEAIKNSSKASEEEKRKNSVSSFEELQSKLANICDTKFWTVTANEESVMFLRVEPEPSPYVKCAVRVLPDLTISVTIGMVRLHSLACGSAVPDTVCNATALSALLENLEDQLRKSAEKSGGQKRDVLTFFRFLISEFIQDTEEGTEDVALLKFVNEQISLFLTNKRVYSSEMLVFASILHSISPHAYHFARSASSLILPHPSTLRRVCSKYQGDPSEEQQQVNFLSYIRERAKLLKPHEKTVTLMIDEVHLKPFFDFKAGAIVGASAHSSEPATTAHVFMTQSLLSSNKDVIHILPVCRMNAETLHQYTRKIIVGIEEMGLKVIAVITDNNSLNRKMMSLFSKEPELSIVYPHPVDNQRPLFYIVDPVHLLKCIRNNWINQKNPATCFYFPEIDLSGVMPDGPPRMKAASFEAVRKLYSSEKTALVKAAYGLNAKAVNPTVMERQNVKLVLNVINSFVSNALRTRGSVLKIPIADSTALFIDIVLAWWRIVNVKTPHKGRRVKDSLQEPVQSVNDQQLTFLSGIIDWLDAWKSVTMSSGTLTRETHTALRLTCYSLVEVCRYCLEELKFKYVLLGKFQTDALEDRFGSYRRLAGRNYHISVRQLYESEKKLRLQKLLTLPTEAASTSTKEDEQAIVDTDNFSVVITEDDITRSKCDMDVIAYIAGYCAHAALKKLSCSSCASAVVVEDRILEAEDMSMIIHLSRGGLKFPQPCVVNMVLVCRLVVEKLSTGENEERFLLSRNQHSIVASLVSSLVQEDFPVSECENGHTGKSLLQLMVKAAANTVLSNFCKLKNDAIQDSSQKKAAARKLKKLKN